MYIKIRVKSSDTWYDVKTDGIVHVLCRNGKFGSVKMLGCLSLCHVNASIFKMFTFYLYLICEYLISKQCVEDVLTC
jgi:hypothetical protein